MSAKIDPQQELFIALKLGIEAKGYAVYDGFLPPKDTAYPFVYLGDLQQTDTSNKSAVFGFVYPTINVWHNNPRQRGTVSAIMLDIKDVCRQLEHTNNFSWLLQGMDERIIADTTTKAPLLHGVLQPNFKFS